MPHISKALMLACSLAFVSSAAAAEDQAVLHRLASNGKVRGSHAKQLVAKVNQRLARAADMPPTMVDPVRVALSQSMLGTPLASDTISAAKVRLKLYAGLNEYVLEAMFTPKKGAIAGCVRDLGLNKKDCGSLVAAAGRTSLAKVKKSAGGPAPEPVVIAAAPVSSPNTNAQASNSTASRFGNRFSSGYQPGAGAGASTGAAAAAPRQAAPAQQPMAAAPQQQQMARAPVAQPQQQQAPVAQPQAAPRYAAAPAAAAPAYVASATPTPAPAAAPAAGATDAKAAYKAQREAYMARQKQQFEERRAKIAGAQAPPADAPAAPAPRPAAAAPAEAEPETALDATMKAAVPEGAAAPAAGSGKAGLDGEFLDGLLDDPLGGAKKK